MAEKEATTETTEAQAEAQQTDINDKLESLQHEIEIKLSNQILNPKSAH